MFQRNILLKIAGVIGGIIRLSMIIVLGCMLHARYHIMMTQHGVLNIGRFENN